MHNRRRAVQEGVAEDSPDLEFLEVPCAECEPVSEKQVLAAASSRKADVEHLLEHKDADRHNEENRHCAGLLGRRLRGLTHIRAVVEHRKIKRGRCRTQQDRSERSVFPVCTSVRENRDSARIAIEPYDLMQISRGGASRLTRMGNAQFSQHGRNRRKMAGKCKG